MRLLREPWTAFCNMTPIQHLYYWLLPLLGGWMLTAMYFSNVDWLTQVVAPTYNREFGLLENLGLFFIVCTLGVLIRMMLLPMKGIFRAAMGLMVLATAFMLLEEIDYGLHIVEWVNGIQPGTATEVRNFHNRGVNTDRLKNTAHAVLGVLFVILPYAGRLRNYRMGQLLIPSKLLLFTVLATALVALLHEALDPYNLPTNRSLDSNMSEFEEVWVYYTFFMYFREKHAQFRKSPELLNPQSATEDKKIPANEVSRSADNN